MLAIAHRAPPSRAQCQGLVDLGVRVFEIDLQVLGGEIAVSHYLPVHPLLPRVRRDKWGFTTRPRLAREVGLAAAVAAVPAEAELLLDLKNDRGARAAELARLVTESDLDPARCHVSTHGWHVLPMLRERGFRTWRSVDDAAALAAVRAATPLADHAVTVRHSLLTAPVVAGLQATGLRVVAWTVNDLARARVLAGFGVDGITSDSPEVLRFAAEAD
jgi:hypothetical protein